MAEKRDELWKRMLQLENAARDKSRYNNRGGQLLKEERERKIIETVIKCCKVLSKTFILPLVFN